MNYLYNNLYAPLTFSIGFIQKPFDEAAAAFASWRDGLFKSVEYEPVRGPLEGHLRRLEPLITPRRRELLLAASPGWTAYFDNGAKGADPTSAVGHMCRVLPCRGLAVTCIPNTLEGAAKGAKGVYGSVKFTMFAAEPREFLNYERSIAATNDGGRWTFVQTGTPQPFEDPERYKAGRVQERFTPDMLETYCRALGIDVFNPDFYGPEGVLVKVLDPLPARCKPVSLAEARAAIGFS